MTPILRKNNTSDFPKEISGFVVLINKAAGWTSFDVVKKIRNIVRVKKVGHAGTLDPFATGLMLVGLGKATKQLTQFSALSKSYRAVIQFGVQTDSYDRTGKIIAENEISGLKAEAIENAVRSMSGEIDQIPPMYSAKKKDGVRLYKLARKNIQVERQAVPVTIHRAEILDWQLPFLEMFLDVSKGTYIRSYAFDLGNQLGVGALLYELERVSIDTFCIDESFSIEEFESFWKQQGPGVVWI